MVHHLHIRPPKRVVDLGGEGDRPVAKIYLRQRGRNQDAHWRPAAGTGGREGRGGREDPLLGGGRPFDLWVM
ncbi:MAG: hypothetical protein AVDCRST_MAG22-531 [uncultured Rubrobacteraceae bacterium]|uniref:Uncharacterized protein n=1 Tax=uncultured Rubrobacteraceae bacterium TaxID=349277 RepID=A0A6J4NPL0_9ACTN|nr:MAG: hypothetical protein AVDCRST_MAG22-531 [uncultured Rubrobacteraceae bacterium]